MSQPVGPLLEAITRAQRSYEVGASPRALFDRMLSDLLELTGSEYGFIGEVWRDEVGTPYLKTHAITNIAWNDATRAFYAENAPKGMEFRNLHSLFGEVLATGEHVIANQPATDPRRCGIPDGHPSLDAFLGAPFFHGGAFVGMVGIANRAGGYDEELLAWLQPLLTTCAGIIAVHRAWVDRAEVEASLRAAKEAAEHASRAKNRFLANMSHELRTPLNAIIGFTGVLMKRDTDPKAAKLLSRVHVNGHQLLGLVEDILDVARIEDGNLEVVLGEVDLTAMVTGLTHDLQGRARPEVALTAELPSTPLVVTSDELRLRQVLTNLMVNALKFTHEGQVVVRVAVDDAGALASVEVADTGEGIASEAMERIFEPFQQADNSMARREGGAGLGLALVRSLGDLLGFELSVTSELGVGSTFRLAPRSAVAQ